MCIRIHSWLLAVLCLLAVPAYGIEVEQLFAPIRVEPQARTWRETVAQNHAWSERVLLAPFRERAKNQSWAGQAVLFAEHAVDFLVPRPDDELPPALLRMGCRVVADGCRDPLILFLVTRFKIKAEGELGNHKEFYAEALAAAEKLDGPKGLAWFIARRLAGRRLFDPVQGDPATSHAYALAQTVSSDGTYVEADDGLILTHLGYLDPNFPWAVDKDLEIFAGASFPEWVHATIEGWLLTKEAESYEHGTPRHTDLFIEARRSLEQAWRLRPDRPEAATGLIAVARHEAFFPNEEIRTWFDRAVAAQFDYPAAYIAMFNACNAGVGGSQALMLAFGDACRATDRYDTRVPQYCQLATMKVSELWSDAKAFLSRPDNRERVIEVNRRKVAEPTRAQARMRNIEAFAVSAFIVGDLDLAAELRRQIPGPLHEFARDMLTDARISFVEFDEKIAALSRPAATALADAARKEDLGKSSAARAVLVGAHAASTGIEKERIGWRIGAFDFQEKLAAGTWFRLPSNLDDVAWKGAPWSNPQRRQLPARSSRIARTLSGLPAGNGGGGAWRIRGRSERIECGYFSCFLWPTTLRRGATAAAAKRTVWRGDPGAA